MILKQIQWLYFSVLKTKKVEKDEKVPKCLDPPCSIDKPRCLNPSEEESCEDNECFCPCDCSKYQVAFRGTPDENSDGLGITSANSVNLGNSLEKAKSINIKVAQTKDILNEISSINKILYKLNSTTSSPENQNQVDKNGNKCYCHCKCCNKNEGSGNTRQIHDKNDTR